MIQVTTRFSDDGNVRVQLRAWRRNFGLMVGAGSSVEVAHKVSGKKGPWGELTPWDRKGPWGSLGPWGHWGPWGIQDRALRGPWDRATRGPWLRKGPWNAIEGSWDRFGVPSIDLRNTYSGRGGAVTRHVTFYDTSSVTLGDWDLGWRLSLDLANGGSLIVQRLEAEAEVDIDGQLLQLTASVPPVEG